MKDKRLNHICGISKNHISNLRKDTIGEDLSKRSRKSIQLDYFDQLALFRPIFGFYLKQTSKNFQMTKYLQTANIYLDFYISAKSSLGKWCVKLRFCCKHQSKKLHVHQKCYVVAERHKDFKTSYHRDTTFLSTMILDITMDVIKRRTDNYSFIYIFFIISIY